MTTRCEKVNCVLLQSGTCGTGNLISHEPGLYRFLNCFRFICQHARREAQMQRKPEGDSLKHLIVGGIWRGKEFWFDAEGYIYIKDNASQLTYNGQNINEYTPHGDY